MSMWRCPHCGTPQAETARCWVCHRSSTTCSTCRHFRRSVAAQVGFCGLDRRHLPLAGDEHRGCWASSGAQHNAPGLAATTTPGLPAGDRRRDFVPVSLVGERDQVTAPGVTLEGQTKASVPPPDLLPVDSWRDRGTLFGDLDR